MIGEYIHNLRSALDNLAFALARLKEDPPKNPRVITFPIFIEREQFERNGRSRVAQLPAQAAELIEKLQPFQRKGDSATGTPQSEPLPFLQKLSNNDKHQIPSVVVLLATEMQNSTMVEYRNDEEAAQNIPPDVTIWGGPIEPGTVLVEHRTKHPLAAVKGCHTFSGKVFFELSNDRFPISPTLSQLGYYTDLIIGQFRQFFV